MTDHQPPLSDVLAKIMQPGAPAPGQPGLDPLAMMMAMMQQQNAQMEARLAAEREERRRDDERRREEKAESNKMMMSVAALIIPKLLDKPALDPLVVKMLENTSNKEAMQQFLQTSSALQQQSSQMFMQQLATMMTSMGDMQSQMTQRQMDMMEARLERIAEGADDDKDETSPIVDIIKSALPALLGNKAPVAAAVVDAAGKVPAVNPATPRIAPPDTDAMPPMLARKVRILQLAAWLQTHETSHPKRAAFFRKLIEFVARSPDVAGAIMQDDSAALFAALGPAVQADAMMGKWIGSMPAQSWLPGFIATEVKPALASVAQAIQRAQEERAAAQTAPSGEPAPEAIPLRPATIMERPVPAPAEGEDPPTLGPGDVAGG